MKHIKIAAGMASCYDYGHVADHMKEALDAGADYCHSDAADMFDLSKSQLMGGWQVIKGVRSITDKPIECHFYTQFCDYGFIQKIAEAGATMLILPAENFMGAPLAYVIDWCHSLNMKVGLTIGCYTPLSFVEESIYDIDRLHIVIHGAGKKLKNEDYSFPWRRSALDLIARARVLIDQCNPDCELAVDGGIKVFNLEPLVQLNVDVMVFSRALYVDAATITEGVYQLRKAIDAAALKYHLE